MKEALFYSYENGILSCFLCPHHCKLMNGSLGRCGVRKAIDNKLYSINYGKIASVCIDPIEKKPIAQWMQGSEVLSVGSFGCNLKCDFCQNYEISMYKPNTVDMLPEQIVTMAINQKVPSIAYTYNEPTIYYEMMYDTAQLANKYGLYNVMVTNGYIEKEPLKKILPIINAMNIDVKTYNDDNYKKLGGSTLNIILDNIEIAVKKCHVEITILIVPEISDDMNKLSHLFIKLSSISKNMPVHINRYFPRYNYDNPATDIKLLLDIQKNALKYFNRVYVGNVR